MNVEKPHTIKIRVSYVHKIDTLTGETWGDLLAFLFRVQDERKETFDMRRGNVVTIRPLDQGFSFEVKDGNDARHYARSERIRKGIKQKRPDWTCLFTSLGLPAPPSTLRTDSSHLSC
jgi:hypothetical protein